MRKTSTILFAILAFFIFSSSNLSAGQRINQTELPKAARTFLSKYYPNVQVVKAEKDNGRHGDEYEVDLADGSELEFTSDGNWKEVKAGRGSQIPAGIIPTGIVNYVKNNHSGLIIVEISAMRDTYKVELSDKTKLFLDKNGKQVERQRGMRGQGGQRGGKRR